MGEELSSQADVLITRIDSSDEGTFGRLTAGNFSCFTGELAWRDNQSNISCIPKGQYVCRWEMSPRFNRHMYGVYSAPGRAGIRKHAANFMGDDTKGFKRQLNGCIALGEKIGHISGQKALILSAPAMRRFETLMGGKEFSLEIR